MYTYCTIVNLNKVRKTCRCEPCSRFARALSRVLDPDLVFLLGSGYGFSTRTPDPAPRQKKENRKCAKSYLLEENSKIMTKGREKNEIGNNILSKSS